MISNAPPAAHGKAVRKYLAAYAEPEAGSLPALPKAWEHVLVVPFYAESPSFFVDHLAWIAAHRSLLVAVVNEPDNAPPERRQANQHLCNWLRRAGTMLSRRGDLTLIELADADVLLVERSGHRALPRHEGVGRARKIGADIALAIWQSGRIGSDWIHHTDADARLPADYFDTHRPPRPPTVGQLCRFRHQPLADDIRPAAVDSAYAYELGLHSYALGLAAMGSPYAFHTIGSTISVTAPAYAAIRGWPCRAAGEDFYLLNKLRKVGGICIREPTITLPVRTEVRTPFGTAAGTARLTAIATPETCYDPRLFEALGAVRDALFERGRDARKVAQPCAAAAAFLDAHPSWIDGARHASRPSLSLALQRRAFHIWFDGFRTMKAANWLRRQAIPALSAKAWLDAAGLGCHSSTLSGEIMDAARDVCFSQLASGNAERPFDDCSVATEHLD